MSSKKRITYPKEEPQSLRETVQKLKSQVKKLQKANRELKSENQTLLEAWSRTEAFLEEVTNGIPIEEIVKYKKLPKKAVRQKDSTDAKEEARKKWADWRKENL